MCGGVDGLWVGKRASAVGHHLDGVGGAIVEAGEHNGFILRGGLVPNGVARFGIAYHIVAGLRGPRQGDGVGGHAVYGDVKHGHAVAQSLDKDTAHVCIAAGGVHDDESVGSAGVAVEEEYAVFKLINGQLHGVYPYDVVSVGVAGTNLQILVAGGRGAVGAALNGDLQVVERIGYLGSDDAVAAVEVDAIGAPAGVVEIPAVGNHHFAGAHKRDAEGGCKQAALGGVGEGRAECHIFAALGAYSELIGGAGIETGDDVGVVGDVLGGVPGAVAGLAVLHSPAGLGAAG